VTTPKILLEYDGTRYSGWQDQKNARTIMGELKKAAREIFGEDVEMQGAGRTDAGVHAEGQVASVSLERPITARKLRAAINGNVGKDLRALQVDEVDDSFHARYSALGKTYLYRLINEPVISPFWVRYAHHDTRPMDLDRMRSAAELFLGEHEWTAFSAAQSDVEDRRRTITALEISERVDDRSVGRMVEIQISADGFLRYMVRTIAGTLMAVGRGELNSEDVSRAIEDGVRPTEAVTAAACGLTLVSVRYQ
jgi:tRNA pseudouridine38-40 synthase